MRNILLAAIIILGVNVGAAARWRTLSTGLELGQFPSPAHNKDAAAAINVLRIDTRHYELTLMNASHPAQGRSLTAREWALQNGLTAAINAAMYQTDYLTSVSLMKTSEHVNNPRLSRDKTVLLFEPLRENIPPVRIADRECDDFEQLRPLYGSAVQSIRMLSCTGGNVWQQNERRWSIAAVGIDRDGRMLFIQSTTPHSVHEFVNILRNLPLSLDRAMYMEGGSPSQMFVNTPTDTLEFIGNFTAGGRSSFAPQIPNVLGIRPRR
jgi:uncharacterized protein YigE (DUF2233 family)